MADRVLILTPFFSPNIGGVETHFDDLVTALDNAGYETEVFTYSPITTEGVEWKGLETQGKAIIRRFRWFGKNLFHRLEKYPIFDFLYLTPYLALRTLIRLLSAKGFDVIHAQGFNAALIAVVLRKLGFKFRLVVSTHAVYELPPESGTAKLIAGILAQADQVLCLSDASKKELVSFGVPSESIELYRYWIDIERFHPMDKKALRQEIGVEDRFTLLFVGRLIQKKGVRELLEVAAKLTEVQFVFIGVGPEEERIEAAAQAMPNVRFLGKKANHELHRYYNLADLFCIPSQYEEGFGRVVIEAVACGVPVLGSNRGGLPEALDPSVAILVDPTAENLERELSSLLAEPEKLAELQNNARAFAESRYSQANLSMITRHY